MYVYVYLKLHRCLVIFGAFFFIKLAERNAF